MDELLPQDSPVESGGNKMSDSGSIPPLFGSTVANQAAGPSPPPAFGFGSPMGMNPTVRLRHFLSPKEEKSLETKHTRMRVFVSVCVQHLESAVWKWSSIQSRIIFCPWFWYC